MNDSWERLYGRRTFGVKLGLHVTEAMLASLDNPQLSCPVVHVAGTNGKGSVCALVASILAAAGCKVGLYTSPHLVRFNERFRIDGQDIPDDELDELVEKIEGVADEVSETLGQEATFFECSTCIAWEHFRKNSVEVAVVETGMGGRLDATNVSAPVVTVITRIGCEHMQYLGSTIEEIAGEKCGIMKPGIPVVSGMTDPVARDVIMKKAKDIDVPVVVVEDAVSITIVGQELDGQKVSIESASESYGSVRMPLLGLHQVENLATAVATCEVAGAALGVDITRSVVKAGVSKVRWAGRFCVISNEPMTVVDGAHNPDAARALVDTWRRLTGGLQMGLIVGMCEDKNSGAFLGAFSGIAHRAWAVPLSVDRNMPSSELLSALAGVVPESSSSDTIEEALEEARNWALAKNGGICITGSLFLAGEMMRLLEGQGNGKES